MRGGAPTPKPGRIPPLPPPDQPSWQSGPCQTPVTSQPGITLNWNTASIIGLVLEGVQWVQHSGLKTLNDWIRLYLLWKYMIDSSINVMPWLPQYWHWQCSKDSVLTCPSLLQCGDQLHQWPTGGAPLGGDYPTVHAEISTGTLQATKNFSVFFVRIVQLNTKHSLVQLDIYLGYEEKYIFAT